MRLRDLPSVDELLRDERLAAAPRPLALAAARAALDRAREEIRAGAEPGDLVERALAELESARAPRLRRALNATGVIIHTNLGRAPLADAALERVAEVGRGYSNLELELESGMRGSRQDHLADILRRLTGAEAALVVNNCAGALLLALAALAEGRDVLVSRGELIEIGDGFRIPDVLERSGARLVEVGTTNRTRAADYERAIRPETAALLAVHQSNFRVVGFTERPRLAELAAIAARHELPLVDDLGAGAFAPLEDEPTARESLAAGADLVTFSGDKLLGGPQAGLVVGRKAAIAKIRKDPLKRALRVSKLTLAALEATLRIYASGHRLPERLPTLALLMRSREDIRAACARLADPLRARLGERFEVAIEECASQIGSGSMPEERLPSMALVVRPQGKASGRVIESVERRLRGLPVPVIGRIAGNALWLDARCLLPQDEPSFVDNLKSL